MQQQSSDSYDAGDGQGGGKSIGETETINDKNQLGHGDASISSSDIKPNSHWYGATIIDRRRLSPTVTGLTLRVDGHTADVDTSSTNDSPTFSFWPGQWVDFYVPSLDKIGGYSLTSIPRELPTLEIAVKASRHPVAQHVTEKTSTGDQVKIRVGGSFVYNRDTPTDLIDDKRQNFRRIMFIAGGVGINPLFGMMRQIHSEVLDANASVRVVLLYSASCKEELLFMSELKAISDEFPEHFRNFFTITRAQDDPTECSSVFDGNVELHTGRLSPSLITKSMEWLNSYNGNMEQADMFNDDSLRDGKGADAVYICGPPGMAEEFSEKLCNRDDCYKVSKSDIHFEQWW